MVDMAVTGGKELLRAMRDLTGPEVKRAIRTGVRAGGNIQLPVARAMAPRDKGDLRRGIVLRVGKRNRAGSYGMAIMVDPKKADFFRARSGTASRARKSRTRKIKKGEQYFYPAAQEFGWLAGGTHHPGHPYLRPSFDITHGQMGLKIEDTIWRKMMEIWGRNATK